MRNFALVALLIIVCVMSLALRSRSNEIEALQKNLNDATAAVEKASNTAAFRPPTAEQAYRLQDDCDKRGESVLNENFIGSALAHEQVSKYNATTNRCYVLLNVHAADLGELDKYEFAYYFEDGQTKELLAWYRIEDQKKAFDGFGCEDYDCVTAKVADCMAGKQCDPE